MASTTAEITNLTPTQNKVLELLRRNSGSTSEAIAVVGMAVRFPGAADVESFWSLLSNGVDAITEVPPERWDVEAFYDPDPDKPGKMVSRWGGFLSQVDQFDAQFFGISPREADEIDPQQRLLLEVSWEALEDAGLDMHKLRGSLCGIYIGISTNDYALLARRTDYLNHLSAYSGTGNTASLAAGRLAHFYGTQGPCMALDTSCSSSLVAVHLACQSLKTGESNLVLAGGVNLLLSPDSTVYLTKLHALAHDGRCKTFDAAADGYVRGEGCGLVVLKRLSDALAEGDRIHAVIRGSAVNHDGRSNGLTAPNGPAQEAVLRQALVNAAVSPDQISYVETHGTGTSLGDPIEVCALASVFGGNRADDRRIAIGSVKTNIGHLEAAAGVASLIKVILCLKHAQISPHLHMRQPNPYIPWGQIPVTVPLKATPWKVNNGMRVAGVSSFGLSGTNAHVIVEEGQPALRRTQQTRERPLHLLTLSAHNQAELTTAARRLRLQVESDLSTAIADICYTANAKRTDFKQRMALLADSTASMCKRLAAFEEGGSDPNLVSARVRNLRSRKVAFLFTGQGSQYKGMGRALYETQPTFRKNIEECDALLRPLLPRPLLSVLYEEDRNQSLLNNTLYAQTSLFALEYALAQMWRSWGVEPAALLGHSIGEYTAACVAGVFSLKDCVTLIAERALLMQALPRGGTMAAVFADSAQVLQELAPVANQVSIAALNAPSSVVISGAEKAVLAVLEALRQKGVESRPLSVSHAFHSPLMEPMLADFERAAATVKYSAPQIPLISNLTGKLADQNILQPSYWRRHVRETVNFAEGVRTLHSTGCSAFVEIGAKPLLLKLARSCIPEAEVDWLSSLRNGKTEDDWRELLLSLGTLYVKGVAVDWTAFDRDYDRVQVSLPVYPFQRRRHWVSTILATPESSASGMSKTATKQYGDSTQIWRPLDLAHLPHHRCWEIELDRGLLSQKQRSTGGASYAETALYIDLALKAAEEAFGADTYSLTDVQFLAPLHVSADEDSVVQLHLGLEQAAADFRLYARRSGVEPSGYPWTLLARAKVRHE